jgi:hypothetical protein
MSEINFAELSCYVAQVTNFQGENYFLHISTVINQYIVDRICRFCGLV